MPSQRIGISGCLNKGVRRQESGVKGDGNGKRRIRNPESRIKNSESRIQNSERVGTMLSGLPEGVRPAYLPTFPLNLIPSAFNDALP